MKLTIPTILTLARIAMIPVLIGAFYMPFSWTNFASTAVFFLASVTDWLDGWIARRYHQYSAFGAFLDPVADKLMVSTALFLIVQGHPTAWMAFWAAVIVGREIAVSALREWMAVLGDRTKVNVASIGKIKTVVQMCAIGCLLYAVVPTPKPGRTAQPEPWMGDVVFIIGDWGLAAAAILTLWSGFQYLRAAWPAMRDSDGAVSPAVPTETTLPVVDSATGSGTMRGSTRE